MKNQNLLTKSTSSTIRVVLLTLFIISRALYSQAQLNPLLSTYYENQYLYNPAFAGINSGLNLNLNYRQQWSEFPGTPRTGSLTADFQLKDKVGLGLIVTDDKAGLITQTRVRGTYAYHVQLGDNNQKLNFGLSVGLNKSRVNYNDVIGDPTDIELSQYNQLKAYINGEFGIAYTNNNLTIGGTIPDLRAIFFKNTDTRFNADRVVFMAMTSYKFFNTNENMAFILEPLAALRIVNGYNDIFDAGVKLGIKNYGLSLQCVYHTSRSLNTGLVFDEGTYALNFVYNFETGPISDYTNGAFEVGLKLRLFQK